MLRSMDTHPRQLDSGPEPVAPELKDHEGPEEMTVVVSAALVLAHQLLDVAGIEETLGGKAARTQELVHESIPFVSQPALHRHAEAFLAASQHRLGQRSGKRALQDPL